MKINPNAKFFVAVVLGIMIAFLFTKNPQILVFIGATILIFIYFELAEKKPKPRRKKKSAFGEEMEKVKSLKIFKK